MNPHGVETPAGESKHRNDERDEQEVCQRIGEVRRDHQRGASPVVLSTSSKTIADPRAATARAAISPSRPGFPVECAHARAEQQRQRSVADRVERKVEGIGDGRNRNVLRARESEEVVEVAGRPEEERSARSSQGSRSARTSAPLARQQALAASSRPSVHPDIEDPVDASRGSPAGPPGHTRGTSTSRPAPSSRSNAQIDPTRKGAFLVTRECPTQDLFLRWIRTPGSRISA